MPLNNTQLLTTLESLKALKSDINDKKDIIIKKNKVLQANIDKLASDKIITVDANLQNQLIETETNFSNISKTLIAEIDFYTNFYIKYIEDNPTLSIDKVIKFLKNLVKKKQKEINITFSRYENGLNIQLQKLSTLELYVQSRKHRETSH